MATRGKKDNRLEFKTGGKPEPARRTRRETHSKVAATDSHFACRLVSASPSSAVSPAAEGPREAADKSTSGSTSAPDAAPSSGTKRPGSQLGSAPHSLSSALIQSIRCDQDLTPRRKNNNARIPLVVNADAVNFVVIE